MSRGTIIAIIVLCAALAGLLVLPKLKRGNTTNAAAPTVGTSATATATSVTSPAPAPEPKTSARAVTPLRPPISTQAVAVATQPRNPPIIRSDDPEPEEPMKPLPTLEKEYLATTNRETRLDLMMDIAENPTADAVKSLTRLFQAEADQELRVDLLDSLLGIDGFKDEKLIMLTLGLQQGLPSDVRQSAIDGLIDLEDTRSVSLLNGLLNDPDPEIREAAQDAIELLQTPPQQIPKLQP